MPKSKVLGEKANQSRETSKVHQGNLLRGGGGGGETKASCR